MADSPEFFLDESMLARALYDLLTQRGHTVHRSGIEVPRGASDRDWLQALGSRPWIVLMRDQRIRFNRLERESLGASRLGAFVFTGGQVTGEETARAIGNLLPEILRIDVREPRPYLYTITRGGSVSPANWQ